MAEPTWLLVHSPLVGPATWQPVAAHVAAAGHDVHVPDLRPALTGPGPYLPALTQRVRELVTPADPPLLLIGHSGAGPLLPALAAALPAPVTGLLYVDSALPYPGRSWSDEAPAELVAHLDRLSVDGKLPPWHQWFPPDTLPTLLPDPELREAISSELIPLPHAYFREVMPPQTWPGPAGYLLLSEAYRDSTDEAAARGYPVTELATDHLALASAPARVTGALRQLAAALPAPGYSH